MGCQAEACQNSLWESNRRFCSPIHGTKCRKCVRKYARKYGGTVAAGKLWFLYFGAESGSRAARDFEAKSGEKARGRALRGTSTALARGSLSAAISAILPEHPADCSL